MIKEMQRKKKILSFSKKQRKELRSVARSKRHNIRLPDPTSPVEFPRFSICASRVLSLGHSSSPSSSWGVCFSTFASFSQPSSKSSLSSSSAASEFSRKDHNLVRKDNSQPWPISRRSLAPVKDLFHSQSRAFRQNNRAKDKCLVWMDFTDRHKGATNFYFMVTVFFFLASSFFKDQPRPSMMYSHWGQSTVSCLICLTKKLALSCSRQTIPKVSFPIDSHALSLALFRRGVLPILVDW